MKRASYGDAIDFIALNDSAGDYSAFSHYDVSGLVTVILISEIFQVSRDKVATDVIRARMEYLKERNSGHE